MSTTVVSLCMTRAGTLWQGVDNGLGFTDLVERDIVTGATLRTVPTLLRLGNGAGSTRDLMELPSLDLLTINRGTGEMIAVSVVDGTIAQTYSLTVSVLDAAINNTGTRLVFFDGTDVRFWKLDEDVDGGTLFTTPLALRCCIWLADCSILGTTATYLGDGTIERYNFAGTLLQSYAYSPSPFAEGQYGIAASVSENRLWVIGDWDMGESAEQPGVLIYNLASGATEGPVIPLVGELTDVDIVSPIAQPYVAIMCDPFPPAPTSRIFSVRRERTFQIGYETNLNVTLDRLEIKMQVGEGTVADPDPTVLFALSKDGGRTFGNERQCSGGRMGEYTQRVYWNQWGQGRDLAGRLIVNTSTPWSILGAIADLRKGSS
jgi:hypothetical protein